ncbi:MAG TPA: polysaccharide deacetylase family protein [Solirubrobacterales bacterium]|nr:polysaccharide deacetylase family protein [Solirubrobacterales bacterium]
MNPESDMNGARALVIADGQFHSLSEPSSLAGLGAVDGEYRQPAPPDHVPEPLNGHVRETTHEPRMPAEIYLTIDTEDDYFPVPHMLTGEGIGEEYGAYGILEILDRYGLTATWFVNVYEAHRHDDPTTVERLVKTIAERGHEVALHTHPSEDLELYPRPLYWFNADQQKEILGYGADLIEQWTGSAPVSFRAGGYVLNDETFEALEALGFRIDSSVFFSSPNNRITPFTVNAVRMRGQVIEVPVTYVPRVQSDGYIDHRKFDVNWLTGDELDRVVDRVSEFGIGQAMFMMHSFSFIDKASLKEDDAGTDRALYRSAPMRSRFVEIYGPKPELRERFERFADHIARDERVEVKTLAAATDGLARRATVPYPDVVPLV